MTSHRQAKILFASTLLLCLAALLSLASGAAGTTIDLNSEIFWVLRLPRTITALAVGGGISVAGTLVQASLGNPLADPYTIGVASAAALGAVIGSLLPVHARLGAGATAFVFAIGGLFCLSLWLRRSFRHATEVLLAGVISSFFFTSLSTLAMALSDPSQWSSSVIWLMGSLGQLSLGESIVALALIAIFSAFGWMHWKPLDLIAVDEVAAETSGVNVAGLRERVFVIVSLITAITVSIAGIIGFLGLIVPHFLRKLGARGHLTLLPTSFLAGAAFLLCSDVLARLVARPTELPVGVITAIFGAPLFLILARGKRA